MVESYFPAAQREHDVVPLLLVHPLPGQSGHELLAAAVARRSPHQSRVEAGEAVRDRVRTTRTKDWKIA